MFTSISIDNFRGFSRFSISDLQKTNLIIGENNAGKTSFLEALFLLGGLMPNLIVTIDAQRGIKAIKISVGAKHDTNKSWDRLFRNFDVTGSIEIVGTSEKGKTRKLKIDAQHEDSLIFGNSIATSPSDIVTNRLLVNTWNNGQESPDTYSIMYNEEGIRIDPMPKMPDFATRIVLSYKEADSQYIAELFSSLALSNKKALVQKALQIIEPKLKALELLVDGGVSIVHCDVGLAKLLPVNLLGQGMVRMLEIILYIVGHQGGVLLIDEIENGFHHSILRDVWKVIQYAARENDVQVFATTHSYECLSAAHKAFSEDDTYDFKVFRLERINDTIKSVSYDRDSLSTSIEMGFEVR